MPSRTLNMTPSPPRCVAARLLRAYARAAVIAGAVITSVAALPASNALAQSKFNPFAGPGAQSSDDEAPPKPWQDSGETGRNVPEGVTREELPSGPINEKARAVDRDELAPVLSPDGSGLPYELWRGLTAAELGDFFATLDIPPRSPALFSLWRRLITSDVSGGGTSADNAFRLRRIEALDRSGLAAEALAALAASETASSDPLVTLWLAKIEIGLGNRERGCEVAQGLRAAKATLPRPQQAEAAVIAGYCAAAADDMTAASLQAGLARELGVAGLAGPDLLDAVSSDLKPSLPKGAKVTLLDYRIAELKGGLPSSIVLANATPSLLGVLARSPASPADLKLPAAEKAAALNVIEPVELAALYALPGASEDAGSLERAALFKRADAERTPLKKARLIRAFLDEQRRVGLYWQALQMMAKPVQALEPVPEIGWFTETAIEVNIAYGNFDLARKWAAFGTTLPQPQGGGNLEHWTALADIADPALATGRSAHLGSVEQMAASSRFDANVLHRLATVLDALDINVPIPLWELSGRAPQPAGGHLPDTGVLTALADAAKKKDFGRTVLLAMKALGSDGAEGAHIIALGDGIRALKRAGLEQEARRLALEGLFAGWPRSTTF